MPNQQDRILVVESDPIISDMIGRQALQAAGYQAFVVSDASSAISKALQVSPEVIIANINLPGLSGKDLLVALSSQHVDTPVIILAHKGAEAEIMQAFRLGAADYLLWPVREAEVVSAVERVLKQVHGRRERERLSRQLQQTNQELQQRVRELTTIFSIGKAVTSVTDQAVLFEKILEGATKVTQADMGWFLLRDDALKTFVLVAQRNLPPSMPIRLNQPWDDGISSLVAMSGESLSIHGEPIKRFKISNLGQSALIAPVKVQKQVIGLLVMLRRKPQPYNESEQHLLEALADYASISLANARLFTALEQRAQQQQFLAESALAGEKIINEILRVVKKELRNPVEAGRVALERLAKDPTMRWTPNQRMDLTTLQESLNYLSHTSEAITPLPSGQLPLIASQANLNELVREAINRFLPFAQHYNVALTAQMPDDVTLAQADGSQVSQVLYALISNAVKVSNPGGVIILRMERTRDGMVKLSVTDAGPGLDTRRIAQVFNEDYQPDPALPRRFGGLGIGLPLVKQIVAAQNGKIWVESKAGQGATFHFTLPLPK